MRAIAPRGPGSARAAGATFVADRGVGGHPALGTAARGIATVVAVAATIGGSLGLALANQPYFDLVNGSIGAQDAVQRALVFSSWLVLIGGPFVLWRPATFGFTLGDLRRRWPVVIATCVAAAAVTAVLLRISGRIPYSDASVVVETILVPVTEELVFRGVLLAILLVGFGRLYRPAIAIPLAIVVDGVGFGVAHLANATSLDIAFVAPQAAFAIALGIACAWLVVRTRSVYPAMLLHGVVNAVVVSV